MVILSSEEFRNQENNRIQMGLERLINKINLQSTRGFGHDGMNPTVETSLNNNLSMVLDINYNAAIGYLRPFEDWGLGEVMPLQFLTIGLGFNYNY